MLAGAGPLVLVGAGKMGGALLKGWLAKGLDPASVTVVDPAAAAPEGVRRVAAIEEARADRPPRTLVLAVKPQQMAEVLRAAAPLAGPDTLVVSVAAGVRLGAYEAAFGPAQPIVRAMPNTPAQVGEGMTVALANRAAGEAARAFADALLSAVGEVAWIEDEALMDAVTAVSGSGPAYVFLLCECLEEAGRAAGLPADLARRLARRTVAGGGALLAASEEDAARLRENVTSPGGTTAAALAVLMGENGLAPLMRAAVAAARDRSVALA